MSKLPNIIQRRELEPLLLKAQKIITHYEKAADCAVCIIKTDSDTCSVFENSICKKCIANMKTEKKNCCQLHMEAIEEARKRRSSHIYICSENLIFWASPFYAGERPAGALISGGVKNNEKDSGKVKALANMLLIYAEQISSISYIQKNITKKLDTFRYEKSSDPNQNIENEISSLDMERKLLANLRRGDYTEARNKLLLLLNTQYQEVKGNIPAFRIKALELVVLLSRAASNHYRINNETILDINNRFLKKIEDSPDQKEITEILAQFLENISEKIFSFHGVQHFSAIRKAERFIWENYTRKLSLQEIADVSGLSAPYFSTIFKEEMGENLSNYLNRLRVEKAAAILLTTNIPISQIAKICGFEDQSWFSKIFKNNTGLTPGKYRDQGCISGISA
ncbi:MAG: helix-turn-helix domain-containing protein [Treponema sp.]|nr:helix-turn-helix domain-containing protein [Treponema sp.]MCL2272914.1 helix-turn-helix domain-containing protein [Treponema sp.]